MPLYIEWIFGGTVLMVFLLVYQTLKNSTLTATGKKAIFFLLGLLVWSLLQAIITLNHVYSKSSTTIPPKIFLFGVLPALVVIIFLFLTAKGRYWIDSLPLQYLTAIHIVRIPVELVLYWLFLHKTVPELMTFSGRNFDILAGITAPFVTYYVIASKNKSRLFLLAWNIICLVLLWNIVILAFLSAPSPLQKLAFDQPNIAILYFPFSWLPTVVVPIVFLSHCIAIRQLMVRFK